MREHTERWEIILVDRLGCPGRSRTADEGIMGFSLLDKTLFISDR